MRAKKGIIGIINHMHYEEVKNMCGCWLEICIMGEKI
jgi:hypothetical protein